MRGRTKNLVPAWIPAAVALCVLIVLPQIFVASPVFARVVSISGICLFLWISEIVPPFVPTLLLWTVIPVFLAPLDIKFSVANVLSWGVDPVMALFFGGLTLGVATERTGLDERLANFALRRSRNSYKKFLFLVIVITAFFSMWISNIAAAALVFASLRPILRAFEKDDILRRTLLIGVAFGADFGGMATPVGTGPNAIAIASISHAQSVSFLSWMMFAFPLTLGMLILSFVLLIWRGQKTGSEWSDRNNKLLGALPGTEHSKAFSLNQKALALILFVTAICWLTEPLHGVPSSVIALGAAAALFISRVLSRKDLTRIGWSTLLLISGGITLGRLLEQSAIVKTITTGIPFADLHPTLSLFLLCMASAALSALMSNTATVILLIPLATAFIPLPSTAILMAISASFGIPFIISTPPNTMAFGQGGVKFGDMFWPGLLMMVLGCALISVTGRQVLGIAGIP